MTTTIVASDKTVVLLGPAPAKTPDLKEALALGGPLVAADGGAEAGLAAGIVPDAVIGDFDSFDPRGRLPEDRLHRIAEQDSTDFEKCLSRIRAPRIVALGFLGRRTDHSLAVVSALVQSSPGWCVLVGEHDVIIHLPARLSLDLAPGTRVSLFPMEPVQGRSTGLEWPIDGIAFAPFGQIGTSNRATGPVTLAMEGTGMLLILPRGALEILLVALENG